MTSVGAEVIDGINEWLEQDEKEHPEPGESHVNTDNLEALGTASVEICAPGTSQVPDPG
jgi:hypothetical protein